MHSRSMKNRSISLLTLLAWVAFSALATSHAITAWRLVRANRELAALRNRLELIPVNDPELIGARRLPSTDKNVRRWAVRLTDAKSQVLHVSWGSAPLAEIRGPQGDSVRRFPLNPDPATHEAAIEITVQRNTTDPRWGAITIDTGDKSIIAINPEITSLLMGEVPSNAEAVGDLPIIATAISPITLWAVEANGNPKVAFCLWIGSPPTAIASEGERVD